MTTKDQRLDDVELLTLLYHAGLCADATEDSVARAEERLLELGLLRLRQEDEGTGAKFELTPRGEVHVDTVTELELPRARVIWTSNGKEHDDC